MATEVIEGEYSGAGAGVKDVDHDVGEGTYYHHMVVVPGNLLASSADVTLGGGGGTDDDDGTGGGVAFLRGHGAYIVQQQRQHSHEVDLLANTTQEGDKQTQRTTMDDLYYKNTNDDDSDDDDESMNFDEDGNRQIKKQKKKQRMLDLEYDLGPGDITRATGEQELYASLVGTVERTNKLISVIPVSTTSYTPQVGDLVIGRIVTVENTQWKVDLGVGSCSKGCLPLKNVHLPGGAQRIRTSEDALEMRTLFATEGDLVSAEVQKSSSDNNNIMLHTRSLKYGKLENGCFIQVPASLIGKMKQHFISLEKIQLDVLLGKNGGIWIQRTIPQSWRDELSKSTAEQVEAPLAETLQKLRKKHAITSIDVQTRSNICRIRNCIEALVYVHRTITPTTIMDCYKKSKDFKLSDLLLPQHMISITS